MGFWLIKKYGIPNYNKLQFEIFCEVLPFPTFPTKTIVKSNQDRLSRSSHPLLSPGRALTRGTVLSGPRTLLRILELLDLRFGKHRHRGLNLGASSVGRRKLRHGCWCRESERARESDWQRLAAVLPNFSIGTSKHLNFQFLLD